MARKLILAAGAAPLVAAQGTNPCADNTFSSLSLYGAEILSATTNLTDVTTIPASVNEWPVTEPITVQVCSVVVQYTHPGWDDTINTYVYLPVGVEWNGRMQGIGGGGWAMGYVEYMALPASQGFAVVTTDGGHSLTAAHADWALTPGGEGVDWHALQDFAAVALDDAATLGKEVTAAFYGKQPNRAYFSGCSTGGRQAHMLAQRYPEQYDGILAAAGAINWNEVCFGDYWPVIVMQELDYYPPPCELQAITQAAIAACDGLDGVEDGIIIHESKCDFDPQTVVGQEIQCSSLNNQTLTISAAGAGVAAAIWQGARFQKTDRTLGYGFERSSDLLGTAATECVPSSPPDDPACTPVPFGVPVDWIETFVSPNKSLSLADDDPLTRADYERLYRLSANAYASVIGTSDPDLTGFREAGGRMIHWHGTADNFVSPRGSEDYYTRVVEHHDAREQQGGDATDYYRYFEAPGIQHCGYGEGYYPGDAMDALIRWVEAGEAPETLHAENAWATAAEPRSKALELCLWPGKLEYVGGNPNVTESWTCVEKGGK